MPARPAVNNLEIMEAEKASPGVVFTNATVVDGTGVPAMTADVLVCGDAIAAVRPVGPLVLAAPQGLTAASESTLPSTAQAEAGARNRLYSGLQVIDCTGLVLTPGFIDIHNHSDVALFAEPGAANYITQGVTTVLVGQCGISAAPVAPAPVADAKAAPGLAAHALVTQALAEQAADPGNPAAGRIFATFAQYLDALDHLPRTVNAGSLVGHGQIRLAVMGPDDRQPMEPEMDQMKTRVAEAMEAGAFGLSTGLIYAPGVYAKTAELIEMAQVAGRYGGLYATHLRSEADLMVDAVMEAVTIGRESGLRVQIAHHKASGRRNWGLVKTTLDIMEYARRNGLEITCDVYPYAPSGASIFALMPAWTRIHGPAGIKDFLSDPRSRERIRHELARPSLTWENILFDAGFDGLLVTHSEAYPEYVGKNIAQVAREQGKDPMDLLLDIAATDVNMSMTAGGMSEDDMRYVLAHRLSMVCSDSSATRFGEGRPHPRNYAAFTRVLATYVREEALLTLEQAVYKMTGFPAWKLDLHDRGAVRPGARADIAVFDYWTLDSKATFGDPHHYSKGMAHVMVNGQFVLKDGKMTGARPGRTLRRA